MILTGRYCLGIVSESEKATKLPGDVVQALMDGRGIGYAAVLPGNLVAVAGRLNKLGKRVPHFSTSTPWPGRATS